MMITQRIKDAIAVAMGKKQVEQPNTPELPRLKNKNGWYLSDKRARKHMVIYSDVINDVICAAKISNIEVKDILNGAADVNVQFFRDFLKKERGLNNGAIGAIAGFTNEYKPSKKAILLNALSKRCL